MRAPIEDANSSGAYDFSAPVTPQTPEIMIGGTLDQVPDRTIIVLHQPQYDTPPTTHTSMQEAVDGCAAANTRRIMRAIERPTDPAARVPLYLIERRESDDETGPDAYGWGGAQYSVDYPIEEHNEQMRDKVLRALGVGPVSMVISLEERFRMDTEPTAIQGEFNDSFARGDGDWRKIHIRTYSLAEGWTLEEVTVDDTQPESHFEDIAVEIWACPPGVSLTNRSDNITKPTAEAEVARLEAEREQIPKSGPQDGPYYDPVIG